MNKTYPRRGAGRRDGPALAGVRVWRKSCAVVRRASRRSRRSRAINRVGAQTCLGESRVPIRRGLAGDLEGSAVRDHRHSERRQYFARRMRRSTEAQAALGGRLSPIVCVGRKCSRSTRRARPTRSSRRRCVPASRGSRPNSARHRRAYEPCGIGTGKAATRDIAQRVIGMIRGLLAELFGGDVRMSCASSTAQRQCRQISSSTCPPPTSTAPSSAGQALRPRIHCDRAGDGEG